MKKVGRFWLPDDDTHFKTHIKRYQYYQPHPYNAAVVHVDKDKTGFLDVGAHCGLWSRMACNHGFKTVIAIEPDKRNIECYQKNMEGMDYSLYSMAVSDEPANAVCIKEQEDNSGSIRIEMSESGDIQVSTVDKIMKKHPDAKIGLFKIDVEGLEPKRS